MKAVATLEAHSSTAWPSLKCPSGIQPKITAAMEARNPTTVAWTWAHTHTHTHTHTHRLVHVAIDYSFHANSRRTLSETILLNLCSFQKRTWHSYCHCAIIYQVTKRSNEGLSHLTFWYQCNPNPIGGCVSTQPSQHWCKRVPGTMDSNITTSLQIAAPQERWLTHRPKEFILGNKILAERLN